MYKSTIAQLSVALESKKISSEELTRLYIERCNKHNQSLNCFITITEERCAKKKQKEQIKKDLMETAIR